MVWRLSSVALACAWRSAKPALAANPLLVALVVAVGGGAVVFAAAAGRRLAPRFAAVAGDEAFGVALAFPLAVTGLLVGVAVAALAPGKQLLGAQLAPAPEHPLRLFLGLTVLPMLALTAVIVALLACLVLPLTSLLPAGAIVGAALLLAFTASVAFGAALLESVVALTRRARFGGLALAGVAGLWAAWGAGARGRTELGPVAVLPGALGADSASAFGAAAALAAATVGASALWVLLALRRPADPPAATRVRAIGRIPRAPFAALVVGAAKRLARHPALRRHAAASAAFALAGGVAAHHVLDASPATGAFFAGSCATLAVAVFPAAAEGLGRDAPWLHGVAPQPPWKLPLAGAIAAVAAAFVLLAAVLLAIAPVSRADLAGYALVEAVAALALGAAALAGAIVPWHPERAVEQLAAYATFAAVIAVAALGLGRLDLAVLGLSPTVLAAVVGHLMLAAGLVAAALLGALRGAS